jgi:hypothetical protein
MLKIEYLDRQTKPDAAFREHASGLIVPAKFSREREVWTRAEWKLLQRLGKMLDAKGVDFYMGCAAPDCRKLGPMQRVELPGGRALLRCAHKDRVFESAF